MAKMKTAGRTKRGRKANRKLKQGEVTAKAATKPPKKSYRRAGERPARNPRAPRKTADPSKTKGLFAGAKGLDLCAARVVVGERAGKEVDQVEGGCAVAVALGGKQAVGKWGAAEGTRSKRGGGDAVGRRGARAQPLSAAVCRSVAAAGHPVRARIMTKLLEGPAVYRSMQRITRLKAGPLYHHINQLRLAGLVMPKQRDLYELSRAGRNLILTLLAAAPLINDRRARPQPGV